jgi:hypothetical protein
LTRSLALETTITLREQEEEEVDALGEAEYIWLGEHGGRGRWKGMGGQETSVPDPHVSVSHVDWETGISSCWPTFVLRRARHGSG